MFFRLHLINLLPNLHLPACGGALYQPLTQLLVIVDIPPHPSDDGLQLGFVLWFLGLDHFLDACTSYGILEGKIEQTSKAVALR